MRTLQPLLIGCLWATFLAVNGRETVGSDRLYGSWAACQGPVCNEVQRQAEGLTRLKLLRNYVVQTMQLMDSLVTSLDEELVKTGQGLAFFVGHRCEAVHPLLQHVITTNVSPDRLNNANLRDDLDASESSHQSEHIRSEDYEDWNNEVEQSSDSSHKSSNVQLEASSSHSTSSVSSSSSSSSVGGQSSTNKNVGKQLHKGFGIKREPYVAPSQPGGREIVSGQGGTGSGFGGGSSGSGGSGSGFGGGSSGGGFGGGSSGSGGSGSGFGGGGFGGGSSGSGGSGSGFGGGSPGSGGSGSGFGGGNSGGSGSGFGGGSSSSGGSGSGFGGGGSGSGGSGSGFGGGSSGSSGGGFGGGSSGGSDSGFGGGSSSSGGSGSGFGGGGSSSGKGGSGSGWGGGSVRQCRGVSQGSPHWVPGLDGWCANNCAAGYCPSTHCVC